MTSKRIRLLREVPGQLSLVNILNPETIKEKQPTSVPTLADNLFEENQGLVYSMVPSIVGNCPDNWDDLIQCGLLALWRAAENFNPDLGFKFSTYAYTAIQRSMFRGIKEMKFNAQSLDELLENSHLTSDEIGVSEELLPESQLETAEIVEILEEAIRTTPRKKEKKGIGAILLGLQGYPKDKIVALLDITPRSYSALVSCGRKFLQQTPAVLQLLVDSGLLEAEKYTCILNDRVMTVELGHNIAFDIPKMTLPKYFDRLISLLETTEMQENMFDSSLAGCFTLVDEDENIATEIKLTETCVEITSIIYLYDCHLAVPATLEMVIA